METVGLALIFWYGILHAFGPDHLVAIADFSIGKSKRKTLLITFAFALGHGAMLFVFAKLLQYYQIPEYITDYGDLISSLVILSMGIYLLFMVVTHRIQLKVHSHNNQEHVHIWFGKSHQHNDKASYSAFTIGALMGIGGVRGMLVTLGLLQSNEVDLLMILMFVLGVSVVFVGLGVIILYINNNLLKSLTNVRRAFATVGLFSVVIGSNMLLSSHSHAVINEPSIKQLSHAHPHNIDDGEQLLATKTKSQMSYKQMMQQMGEGLKVLQTGVLTQNKTLVLLGCDIINNHPAPKEKPWSIVKPSDAKRFKETLIAYNQLLHTGVSDIQKSVKNNDWIETNKALFNLSNHCVSCHSVWKNNLK
jgi:ABC-type nickel/cobalt efflux system permease component RcnA